MLQVRTIKKLIFSLTILLVSINVQAQEKTIINVNSDREAVKLIFSNLTDSIYNYALLNRVFDKSKFVYEQVFDNYNTIYNALDWVEVYDNIALSYIDTSMFSVHKFVNDLTKYFEKVEEEFNEELIQPFGFILQNISQIDSVHFKNGDVAFEEGKLTLANIEENYLYNKVLIKSACNLEASTYPFYSTPLIGKLQYDERFIFISDDIELLSLEINVKDGKGFQEFGVNNPIIEYSREIDSLIATVQYSYLLNDSIYYDRVKFYINIKGVESSKFADGWDIIKYGVDPVPDNDLKYNVGILYGCGNVLSDGETPAIKRPIIISPPYRPPIQFYFFLQPWGGQNYFEQFDISLLFQRMSMMGYDVIFIKERPGNVSLETAGEELAQFIKNINVEKENNFPDEHWENVVMGYSAGGQKARYALMKLEKEHMTPGNYGLQGGPHHLQGYTFLLIHHIMELMCLCQPKLLINIFTKTF